MPEEKNLFIHHVFFWLANPQSATDRDQLITGLRKLSKNFISAVLLVLSAK
jgi:hypothetical protein